MVSSDDVIAGLFLVIIAAIYWLLANYGLYVVGGLVLTWLICLAYQWFDDNKHTFCRDPPPPPTSWVLARGDLDTESYVLVRSRIKSPYQNFPAQLSLSYFDRNGAITRTYTKVLHSQDNEKPVLIGKYRTMRVVWTSTSRPPSNADFDRAENPVLWKLYPLLSPKT